MMQGVIFAAHSCMVSNGYTYMNSKLVHTLFEVGVEQHSKEKAKNVDVIPNRRFDH